MLHAVHSNDVLERIRHGSRVHVCVKDTVLAEIGGKSK